MWDDAIKVRSALNANESESQSMALITKPPANADNIFEGLTARGCVELRLFANSLKSGLRQKTIPKKSWGGHPAVTESLVRGLRMDRIPFSFNPMTIDLESNKLLGILGGMSTFSWALAQGVSAGKFRLLVGPNVFETPLDVGRDCLNPAIVGLVTPSNWVRDFYASELPEFDRPIHVWAAGVDSDFWSPSKEDGSPVAQTALLYVKSKNLDAVERAKAACEMAGFTVKMVTYGRYSRNQYRKALRQASVMVVVGGAESQGLALFEAWSVGVPTLVFRHDGRIRLRNHPERQIVIEDPANAAPYLSPDTGLFWNSSAELLEILHAREWEKCQPREWIVNNATLAISARKYADIFYATTRD